MTFLTKISRLPSGSRALFDSNIFVYWVTDHPRFANSCEEVIRRVEEREIQGVIPAVVLNELLHRLIIAEAVEEHLVDSPTTAVTQIKDNPGIISQLAVAWTVYQEIIKMPFEVVESARGLTNLTYYFSKELSLMARDAAIAAYAHSHHIDHIITNDRDFERVPWLTCWRP